MEDMQEYLKKMVDEGYINEDGSPIKCVCGETEFEMTDKYYSHFGIEEYQLKCPSCGAKVGHWAFGNWLV